MLSFLFLDFQSHNGLNGNLICFLFYPLKTTSKCDKKSFREGHPFSRVQWDTPKSVGVTNISSISRLKTIASLESNLISFDICDNFMITCHQNYY